MTIDGMDLLGHSDTDSWQRFLKVPYDLQVCSYFATGVYDKERHDPRWMQSILDISRLIPDTSIVKATFRRLGHLAQHRDLFGYNYLWIHQGRGFQFEGDVVPVEPGDVLRFDRSREHGVVDTGAPFYRTNIVGQTGMDQIDFWDSAFPTTCWFTDGHIFDRSGERPIPWTLEESQKEDWRVDA